MRNRIFGAIGVIWGAGILISYFIRGRGAESDGAYASGQLAGVILGGLLFAVGLYFLVKGSKKVATGLKQTEARTIRYCSWDSNSILAEFNDTGSALNWTKSYVYLGARLLAAQTPTATNYHHPDRLGTRLVTSAATAIEQNEQTTLPYGTALDAESWGTATNRRFTSYDRSQTTKLDDAVNRSYSAALC